MKAWKGFTLLISNEDSNDNIKIIRIFGCTNWWSYWDSETWNKKQQGEFIGALLAPLAASLMQPVVSLIGKDISPREIRRARRA